MSFQISRARIWSLTAWTIRIVILVSIPAAATAQYGAPNGEWPYWGGDSGSTRYTALDQIDKENAGQLQVAWRWKSLDQGDRHDVNLKATPIMVGGSLYTSTGINQAAAIDPATGETRWVFTPEPLEVSRRAVGRSGRGVAYWTDGDDERIFLNTSDGRLIAVNAKTGRTYPDFGEDGYVDLKVNLIDRPARGVGSSSPPIVCNDVVVVQVIGAIRASRKEQTPGHVRGYDPRTGERLWIFHTVPQAGEFGVDTWDEGSWQYTGNTGVWTIMSADEELGYVYLPLETPTHDFYGGHRPGDNLFAESLVCLDAKTGRRVWHFQMIHHGVWDYDLPAAPVLCDIEVDGRKIKAVAQVSKQGFCYVFDRVTGEPVWPIEERPVPQTDVPGESTAPTQPFPTKPAPFEPQGFSIDNLIDFTPELRAEAIEIASQYRMGPLFSPPSMPEEGGTQGTWVMPGYGGGANWTGAAADAERGVIFIPSRTRPLVASLVKPDASRTNLDYLRGSNISPEGPRGLPIVKPPYSRITAIDLNTGDHLWMKPNGPAPEEVRNHPDLQGLGLDFSAMGQMCRPGALVTKTLVFVGESGGLRGDPGGPMFRAYDKMTGEVAAEIELPSKSTASPMSYFYEGKQYIVIAVATREFPAELVALSLP